MTRVLIAGAGIGGLVAAIALRQRGFDVALFEQTREPRELGAGLQLGPNATRVLIALGLESAMQRVVCPAAGKEIRLWNTGQSWNLFDLGEHAVKRYGAPYWMVHRGDFHSLLLEMTSDAANLGANCTGFTQDPDTVTLRLGSGEHIHGDVLVGADGVHSCIRQQIFGKRAAWFTGLMAWRGLVSMQRLPPHLRRPVGANWVGPASHVVTYPLRRGEILNVVGVVERGDWRIESWTERGTTEECAREPLPRLSEGRVALLGDAAHPMLPFLAQGASMAIEDGLILARCLEACADPAEALHRYDLARLARTTRCVLGSLDNATRFHHSALTEAAAATAYVDHEWQPDKVAQRYDWAFEYDALTVPV